MIKLMIIKDKNNKNFNCTVNLNKATTVRSPNSSIQSTINNFMRNVPMIPMKHHNIQVISPKALPGGLLMVTVFFFYGRISQRKWYEMRKGSRFTKKYYMFLGGLDSFRSWYFDLPAWCFNPWSRRFIRCLPQPVASSSLRYFRGSTSTCGSRIGLIRPY